jgi:polysaccharide export outer membrane protein
MVPTVLLTRGFRLLTGGPRRAACLAVVFLLAGCASGAGTREATELALLAKHAPFQPFTIGPGDVLAIEVEGNPDLNRQLTVAPDGSISLRLLGDVHVLSLTIQELREKVCGLYEQYIGKPRIEVTLIENRSARVYVLGQVMRPGSQPYVGQQTLLDAISAAGGVTPRAAPRRVLVVRGDPENPQVFRINLSDIVNKGRADQNLFLAQNDVVFVPPNAFATVGFTLDNIFFPFQSLSSAATTVLVVEELGTRNQPSK